MESDICALVLSMSVKFFRMVLYIIQVRQIVWTHSPDREKLFLNGQLRYQWLEASVGSITLRNTSSKICWSRAPTKFGGSSISTISGTARRPNAGFTTGLKAPHLYESLLVFSCLPVLFTLTRHSVTPGSCATATKSCLLPASERKHRFFYSSFFPRFSNAGRPAWPTSPRRSLTPLLGRTNTAYEQ